MVSEQRHRDKTCCHDKKERHGRLKGMSGLMNKQTKRVTLILIVMILTLIGFGQQKPPASSPRDRFIGEWKLNIAKSSLPPGSESIVIEPRRQSYRIRCNVRYHDGTELDFWSLTDMKGEVTKVVQSNGEPMNEEWRVTRESPNSFTIDSRPFPKIVRYTVNTDGRTLTMRTLTSAIVGAKIENRVGKRPVRILVFDKVQ